MENGSRVTSIWMFIDKDARSWAKPMTERVRLPVKLFPCGEFDAFVRAIVDAYAFVLDNAITE